MILYNSEYNIRNVRLVWLSPVVFSQQFRKVYFISLTVVTLLCDLTTKYY